MQDPTPTDGSQRHRWPESVYGSGSEPDPRFTLANERTFLAWIRTTLALLAGAAAVDAIDLSLPRTTQTALALLMAVAGMGCAIRAWRGWARTERALRHAQPLPSNGLGIGLAIALGVIAIILGVAAVARL